MSGLLSRLERAERMLPPLGRGDQGGDLTTDPEWMGWATSMGADHVRQFAEDHPEWRGRLGPLIAAADEIAATEPQWRLEGPWGQRRWRYGVREGGHRERVADASEEGGAGPRR